MELETQQTTKTRWKGFGFSQPLPSAALNVDNKSRSNLFAWRGQFTPQLVEALLEAYGPSTGCVLDPFAGSGTVLVESSRLGLAAAGCEINPAAMLLAQTYEFVNHSEAERRHHLEGAEEALRRHVSTDLPLFVDGSKDCNASIHDALIAALTAAPSVESKRLVTTLAVSLDFAYKKTSAARLWSIWKSLKHLVKRLPSSPAPVRAILADARALPLRDDAVDFVVTSPPYINVFNYHQNYRRTVEALGWRPLKAAGAEIGSNRKFRQNRFLTVVQYCLDMTLVLLELQRVCKPDAKAIFVIGRESNVRKTPFYNAQLLASTAQNALGFDLALAQERVFKNKFGQDIYEDILHLSLPSARISESQALDTARSVARQALIEALDRAPQDVTSDLEAALQQVCAVKVSSRFSIDKVHINGA